MMYYTWVLAIVSGILSAIHSGGHLFESPQHFTYFVLYMIVALIVGGVLDSYGE